MKIILICIAVLMVTVTSVQAKRKNNTGINIYNQTIIQDNRTKTERAIDRANAQVQRNRSRADARRDQIMNRAYSQANKNNRRMRRDINRILNNSKIKNNKRPKYRTRKYF
jgi:hypothetical protein